MLLYIDDSGLSAISNTSRSDYPDAISAFENIATSWRYGHHIVLGDSEILKTLSSCKDLSVVSRSAYKSIFQNLPTLFSILAYTQSARCIIYRKCSNFNSTNFFYNVQLLDFSTGTLTTPALLIGENLSDIKLFVKFGQQWVKSKRLRSIKLSICPTPGGGSTTADVFQHHSNARQHFALCITDSDRTHPGGATGQTAKKLNKISKTELSDYYILEWRELENYMPTHYLEECFSSDINKKKSLQTFTQLSNARLFNLIRYIDVKDGLRLKDLRRGITNARFRKHYYSILDALYSLNIVNDCKCNNVECHKCTPCSSIFIQGLGQDVLDCVYSRLPDDCFIQDSLTDKDLEGKILDIGQVVFDVCCGFEPDLAY